MAETRQEDYQQWWHSARNEIGLANALALQHVKTVTMPAHKVELFSHHLLGWVVVVDDRLYSIENDSGFREMLIHVPLLGRQREQCRVLLLGCEGAILREVLRHDFVTEVVVAESEPVMLEIGRDFLGFAAALSDSRVKYFPLAAKAALEVFERQQTSFDFIVPLYPKDQTSLSPQIIAACLTDGGVCVDSDWFVLGKDQQGWWRDLTGNRKSLLSLVEEGTAFHSIQSYYGLSPWMTGYRGFFLYTKDAHSYSEPYVNHIGSHYNTALHRAAFALPTFWPAVEIQRTTIGATF